QGFLALDVGALVKQRLLAGATRLAPEEVRGPGVGQLLGRVIESEAVESLATNGGLAAAAALVELAVAGSVLPAGPRGAVRVAALVAGVLLAVPIAVRQYRRLGRWTEVRLAMTHDLVERMTGYRTRLAQEAPERWHDGEDHALEEYLTASRELDAVTVTA